jgi:hypothetical protein
MQPSSPGPFPQNEGKGGDDRGGFPPVLKTRGRGAMIEVAFRLFSKRGEGESMIEVAFRLFSKRGEGESMIEGCVMTLHLPLSAFWERGRGEGWGRSFEGVIP